MSWKVIVSALWLVGWALGGYGFMHAAGSFDADADYVSQPSTEASPGNLVRLEGRLAPGPVVDSVIAGKPCLASLFYASYVASYQDSQNKTRFESARIVTRRIGAAAVDILWKDQRIALPVARWDTPTLTLTTSRIGTSAQWLDALPSGWGISAAEVAAAKSQLTGAFSHFEGWEWVLEADRPVFIAGRLERRAGGDRTLQLESDPKLGRIEVFPGTQAELVSELRGNSSGLRLAGGVFFGLSLVPTVLFLSLARRSMSRGGG